MSTVPGDFGVPFRYKCFAALQPGAPLQPYTITRRALTPKDVAIKIMFAGICHSDIHSAREEWGKAIFPMVPGHKIIGRVEAIESSVGDAFNVGDIVGIGCMVGSCQSCDNCKVGLEQYCKLGCVLTYNGKEKYPHMAEYNEQVPTSCRYIFFCIHLYTTYLLSSDASTALIVGWKCDIWRIQ